MKWIGRRKSEREENRFLKSFVQTGILGSPKIKYFRSPLFFFHHNKRYFLSNHFPYSPLPKTFSFFAFSILLLLCSHCLPNIILLELLVSFSFFIVFLICKKKYKYGTKSTRRPDWVIWSYFSIPSLMKAVNKTFVISGCVTSNSGSQYVYL